MILLSEEKCQYGASQEMITACLGWTIAGTNRVPEALGPAGAGIDSSAVLTGRIGEFGFIDRPGHHRVGPPADDPAQDQRPSMDGGKDSAMSQLSARGWCRFPFDVSLLIFHVFTDPVTSLHVSPRSRRERVVT